MKRAIAHFTVLLLAVASPVVAAAAAKIHPRSLSQGAEREAKIKTAG